MFVQLTLISTVQQCCVVFLHTVTRLHLWSEFKLYTGC